MIRNSTTPYSQRKVRGNYLVADKGLNAVYAITAPYFGPGAYSAVSLFATLTGDPTASLVGTD